MTPETAQPPVGHAGSVLLLAAVVGSCLLLGYWWANPLSVHPPGVYAGDGVSVDSLAPPPVLVAATPSADLQPASSMVLVDEMGRLQADILQLRMLFERLADIAELDDEEFELDVPFTEEAERLDAWRESDNVLPLGDQVGLDALSRQLALSIQAVDHISSRARILQRIFVERHQAHDQRISGSPVHERRVSSHYGYRLHPFSGERSLHQGLDFPGDVGEPVMALADGIVSYSGVNGAYGNLVEIEHVNGYRTRYAHNKENLVDSGQRVHKGELIARLGSSGRSTGPHVHVEVRRHGVALDPAIFLR